MRRRDAKQTAGKFSGVELEDAIKLAQKPSKFVSHRN